MHSKEKFNRISNKKEDNKIENENPSEKSCNYPKKSGKNKIEFSQYQKNLDKLITDYKTRKYII